MRHAPEAPCSGAWAQRYGGMDRIRPRAGRASAVEEVAARPVAVSQISSELSRSSLCVSLELAREGGPALFAPRLAVRS